MTLPTADPNGDANDLQMLAQQYLDACVAALESVGGAPDVRFISPGPPSWDCPNMLSVHIGGPVVADTLPLQPQLAYTHRIAIGIEVKMILMTATILRCDAQIENDGDLPSDAEITEVAAQTNADVWAIWSYLTTAKHAGLLWAPKREREMALLPAIPQKQEGGACGWEIPITVQLNGYRFTGILDDADAPNPGV